MHGLYFSFPLLRRTACGLLLSPAAVLAQQTLTEVVVTGSRNEAPTLDTARRSATASHVDVPTLDLPASVSGVSAEQIDEHADRGAAEAVTRTVGLSAAGTPGNGGLAFASRGFYGVNSVGVAEDGITLGVGSGTISYPSDTWGYERFEVLRGPASLMYGSGTMGATVNAIRKQPSRERSTELLLSGGSHGTARMGLGSTGALSDTLSYRVDAYGARSDGDRAFDNSKGGKLMSALRWQPRGDFTLDLTADISSQAPSRYYGTPTINGRVARELIGTGYNTEDSDIHYRDKRFKAKATWQVNDALAVRNELYHFGADRHWKNIEAYDYNPVAGTVARSDYLEIGHALQQNGNRLALDWKSSAHQVAVGWDVSQANFRNTSNSPYTGSSVVSAFDPVPGTWISPDPYLPRMGSTLRQNALYIEDAWKINEQWLLMGGIRRDWYEFSRQDFVAKTGFDKDLNGTSWRLGLTRKLTAQSSVYAQMTTGHDPVISLLSLAASQTGFSLSKGRQQEVGFKQQLADGRGEWTAALFHIAKGDIITRDPANSALSIQGGKQSSRGLELTGALQASPAFRLEANAAYTKARFDELIEAGGVDRSGNRPANVPKVTANLWGHYREGGWRTSLGLRYVGSRFGDNANSAGKRLPGYTVLDAVVSWNATPQTTFSLIGRNLTNRVYATAAYNSQWLVGASRSVELMAQMRF
ncbi:TonB-dependent receptor [Comamonas odontotermitis]|uniref:TonB-dependent receptor n=1 Tax=Comamonas odontotermitis TaxID=379895 RepID=UPI001CC53FE8|nr:TonB-dependent receptor [Comamonas odontotermitis]UBB16809.1 TonB-dependent receptor [Comamonas odontotermitis]